MKPHPLFRSVYYPGADPIIDPGGRCEDVGIPIPGVDRRLRFFDRHAKMGWSCAFDPDRHKKCIVLQGQGCRCGRRHRVNAQKWRFNAVIHPHIDQHNGVAGGFEYLGNPAGAFTALHNQFDAASALQVTDPRVEQGVVERAIDDC